MTQKRTQLYIRCRPTVFPAPLLRPQGAANDRITTVVCNEWHGMPPESAAAVLLIEDADSPTPSPLVHAIVADLPQHDGTLAEGALTDPAGAPAPGDGPQLVSPGGIPAARPAAGPRAHRYAFQLFALDTIPHFETPPGRGRLVKTPRHTELRRAC